MAMVAYRLVLFAVATFAFVVLLDRGPAHYPAKFGQELSALGQRLGLSRH
jgi:hypothetical protein